MKEDTSKLEILEAIGLLAEHIEDMRVDMTCMKADMTCMKTDMADMKTDMADMKSRTTRIEATMVTKDYLDDKLADEGSRYGGLIRQTNKKIDALTDALVSIGSLPVQVAKRISGMEPFGSQG